MEQWPVSGGLWRSPRICVRAARAVPAWGVAAEPERSLRRPSCGPEKASDPSGREERERTPEKTKRAERTGFPPPAAIAQPYFFLAFAAGAAAFFAPAPAAFFFVDGAPAASFSSLPDVK
jgi:hypothetical protein